MRGILFDGLLRGQAVLALGAGEIVDDATTDAAASTAAAAVAGADRGEHGEVGDDGRDGIECVPADYRATAQVAAVVQSDLRYAHQHLAVEFAVVAPHDHLNDAMPVVASELERLLVYRIERAPLRLRLLLLHANVTVE